MIVPSQGVYCELRRVHICHPCARYEVLPMWVDGPAHQSWTPMTILSDPLGRLERFGADVAE